MKFKHIFWISILVVGMLAPLLVGQSANDIEFKQYDGTKWIWKSIPTDAYILGNTTLNAGKTLTINGALNSENGSLTLGDIDVTGTIYAGDNGKTAEFAALKTTILNPLVGDPGSGIIDLETSLLGTGNWNVGNGNLSVAGSVNTQSVLSNPPGDVKIDVLNSQLEGDWETTGTHTMDALTVTAYERHIQVPVLAVGTVANQPTPIDVGTAGGFQFASSGTQEELHFQWEVPDDWDGTDITVEIDWVPDSGGMTSPHTIRWTFEYRCVAEGEAITNGSAGTETVDYSTTTAQYVTVHSPVTLPYNDADQPIAAQDHIYFRCFRDTTVGDDFPGTVVATAFEILYNSTSLPTSN